MILLRLLIVLVFVGACTGCASSAKPSPGAPPSDAPQSIPPDFVLSTNEPFWRAQVQGTTVLLNGPDQERRFTVETNEALFDGRAVTATDSKGTLELRVTERLCMDSMSGKTFAYTGRLTLDGGTPVTGCGGPL